jgi:uncharacterized membrane protein
MTVTPGESLQEFYDTFDTDARLYKGVKLNGPLPIVFAEDNDIIT